MEKNYLYIILVLISIVILFFLVSMALSQPKEQPQITNDHNFEYLEPQIEIIVVDREILRGDDEEKEQEIIEDTNFITLIDVIECNEAEFEIPEKFKESVQLKYNVKEYMTLKISNCSVYLYVKDAKDRVIPIELMYNSKKCDSKGKFDCIMISGVGYYPLKQWYDAEIQKYIN